MNGCACNCNITINAGGQPLLQSTSVNVGTDSVNIALGFRRIPKVGYFTVSLNNPIAADTTGTLPVTLTLNRISRNLTLPNGTPVTAALLLNVGAFEVYNDWFKDRLYLTSRTVE